MLVKDSASFEWLQLVAEMEGLLHEKDAGLHEKITFGKV
jgi:hypothetical protein